jgi:hypothetical protein
MFEWRGESGSESTNDVEYARSLDGGNTWQTANGSRIETPITHGEGDTLIDTLPTGSGLINNGGLTVDSGGLPHGVVAFQRPGSGVRLEHLWFDGATWQRGELDEVDLAGRAQLAGTPDGRVWLIGVRGTELVAVDITPDADHASTREIAQVPATWEPSIDSQALARWGRVEMLVPRGDRPHVVVAELDEP